MDGGCMSDPARKPGSSSFFLLLSLSSSTSLRQLYFSNIPAPFSPFCASSISCPLIWGNQTSYIAVTSQERQEVVFAHHRWTRKEKQQTFMSPVAITQPIIEPAHNQGNRPLLCITKDLLVSLIPYFLFITAVTVTTVTNTGWSSRQKTQWHEQS